MLSQEAVAAVACSFVTQYYKGLVRGAASLAPFYGPESVATFAAVGAPVGVTNRGLAEIHRHLQQLDHLLGPRKVAVTTVDFAPAPNKSIVVACTGVIYSPVSERQFAHSFLVAAHPTFPSTFFLAAESLRVIAETEYPVQSPPLQSAARHAPVAISETPPTSPERNEPHKHRSPARQAAPAVTAPPRQVFVEHDEEEDVAAPEPTQAPATAPTSSGAVVPPVEGTEKKIRERKKRAERPKRSERKTYSVVLYHVPRQATLKDVEYYVGEYGRVVGARWYGRTDAIVEMVNLAAAKDLINDLEFQINSRIVSCGWLEEQQ